MAEVDAARVRTGQSAKAGEFGFPLGHLGHLTEEEQHALVEFKELCAKHGIYTPKSPDAPVGGVPGDVGQVSHDDTTML